MKAYIGDLCYVLNEADWQNLCGQLDSAEEAGGSGLGGHFEVNGKKLWLHSTAYGDDVYFDEGYREYCVDSGTIGVIEVEENQPPVRGGQIVYLPDNAIRNASYEDGVFRIGEIKIITGHTDPDGDEFDPVDY